MSSLRVVDGSAEAAVRDALAEALVDGGTPVLPVPGDGASARRVLAAARPDVPVKVDDCAAVVVTSGSSGEPKAVMLSRQALVASAEATHERLGGPGQWLLAMPAYFIGGLQVLTRSIVAGYETVVADSNFEESARRLTGRRRYTALVPTQLGRLVDSEALRAFDAVLVGGAACSPELLARARDAGVNVVTAYGMTETGGGCVYDGRPLDGVRIGFDGERILLGGPTLFSGYRLRPDLTAAALDGGWFRTADRGRMVDGRLEVRGRLDDVVVSGGVNVALPAVRDRLRAHPDVVDAEVVGVPDDEWGTRVVAFVVATHPAERDRSSQGKGLPGRVGDPDQQRGELRDWVAGELPRSWAPRDVIWVDALPMLASGKVDRRRLTAIATDPAAGSSSEMWGRTEEA